MGGKNIKYMRCSKCKTKIVTHLWLSGDKTYCAPGCERGAKSQFDKLYRALRSNK